MFQKTTVLFILCFFITFYSIHAQIPDPVGDASPPSVDYVAHYFEQQGESLYIAITMNDVITNRIQGYSTHTFFTDTDFDISTGQPGSRVGSENNLTFTDIGTGYWFMRLWVLWDHDPAYNSFAHRALAKAKMSPDGKTMSYKFSLVGLNWEDVQYDLNGWYKDGTCWHQVPHYPGDEITDVGLYTVDNSVVTQLVTKEGTKCTIEVPTPYSATADAKDIPGVVDQMVTLMQSHVGTISDPTKKYIVSYEMFEDFAKPYPYISGLTNLYTTRIPGSSWIDDPDWFAMLSGLQNMTLSELNAGARTVLITQHSYQRPIPGSGETWYCTTDDSTNGFLWDAFHKYSFKALLGKAFENCLSFHIAESMTDGEAKTAISNKKAEMLSAWTNFSGDAFDLTPEIMTGFLIQKSPNLNWTERVYKRFLPTTLDLQDTSKYFSKLVNNYIENAKYRISSCDDFLTQAHHGWYASIASVQAAVLSLAMDKNLFTELGNISKFPLDSLTFNDAIKLLLKQADGIYTFDASVPYVWNEIKSTGTALTRPQFTSSFSGGNPDTDDGAAGPISMGMNFDFYGNTFDSVYIGVNGLLSFTDHIDWITNSGYGTTIPGMGWDNIVCPLACDLMAADAYPNAPYNTATGTIYYYHDAGENTFTIEYYHITNHYFIINDMCVDTTITFQIVLDADDNSITFYYNDLGIADENVAKRATVGIQPLRDSMQGVQFYGANLPKNGYPVNGTAIRFYPSSVTGLDWKQLPPSISKFKLYQNYPNPFNPETTIAFDLMQLGLVQLKIYNVLGEEVKTLINLPMFQGYHKIKWDGTDNLNNKVASGIYIYTLKVDNYIQSNKMILLK